MRVRGIAIGKLLLKAGAKHITLVSLEGIVCEGETWMNEAQIEVSKRQIVNMCVER